MPKILMRRIPAHVRLARRRRSKEEHIVRDVHTRRIVGRSNHLGSPWVSLTRIYSMRNVWEKLEQEQTF